MCALECFVSVWPPWVLCPLHVATCVITFVGMVLGNVFCMYFYAQ